MRISYWSSDVCSSDLKRGVDRIIANECSSDGKDRIQQVQSLVRGPPIGARDRHPTILPNDFQEARDLFRLRLIYGLERRVANRALPNRSENHIRSEEHTSELQSLMRISYAVFCLKKKKTNKPQAKLISMKSTSTRQQRKEVELHR